MFEKIIEAYQIETFVSDIFSLEGEKGEILPFFADGFPGIVFLQTDIPATMLPMQKPLPSLFLYGQTIQRLEMVLTSRYQMLIFKLQPFAIRTIFGLNPKLLNDDCHDLSMSHSDLLRQLQQAKNSLTQADILAKFIEKKSEQAVNEPSQQIQIAVGLILASGGKIVVKTLAKRLHLTERTLQRLFVDCVGISPKQFAKIIQFQKAYTQISDENFDKLADIAFENGYADQSHFIRNFRRFTEQKPSDFT